MKPIDTPCLHLRALCADDEALYCGVYSSPQLMRHLGEPLSAAEAAASFAVARRQNAMNSGSRWWVVVLRDSMERIGLLGTIRRHGVVEVGVMLLPPWQGRGYAFEAISALIDRSFEQPADVIRITHAASNVAMAGLMRKLRFERVAAADGARWEVDRDRWRAAHADASGDFTKTGSGR